MRKNTASAACPTPPRRPSRSAEGLTVRTPLDVSMVICARASRILDSSKAAASALSALSNPAYRTMSGSDSASDWRASRIRGHVPEADDAVLDPEQDEDREQAPAEEEHADERDRVGEKQGDRRPGRRCAPVQVEGAAEGVDGHGS